MIIFCIYYYLIIYFLFKALGVVDLNTTLYQLEKEKELRASLFKITHEIKNPIAVCKGYLDLMDINKDKENMNIILNTFLKKDYIIIKIKDNGSGMDKETLDNIGKMFYTTKIKGTGLGVSLSKEIIKLHDGNMKYESIPGKGTTVSITLPLKSM